MLDTPKKLAAAKIYLPSKGRTPMVYVGGLQSGGVYRWLDKRYGDIRHGWCPREPGKGICVVILRTRRLFCLSVTMYYSQIPFLCEMLLLLSIELAIFSLLVTDSLLLYVLETHDDLEDDIPFMVWVTAVIVTIAWFLRRVDEEVPEIRPTLLDPYIARDRYRFTWVTPRTPRTPFSSHQTPLFSHRTPSSSRRTSSTSRQTPFSSRRTPVISYRTPINSRRTSYAPPPPPSAWIRTTFTPPHRHSSPAVIPTPAASTPTHTKLSTRRVSFASPIMSLFRPKTPSFSFRCEEQSLAWDYEEFSFQE